MVAGRFIVRRGDHQRSDGRRFRNLSTEDGLRELRRIVVVVEHVHQGRACGRRGRHVRRAYRQIIESNWNNICL